MATDENDNVLWITFHESFVCLSKKTSFVVIVPLGDVVNKEKCRILLCQHIELLPQTIFVGNTLGRVSQVHRCVILLKKIQATVLYLYA
ncbi:unnamed protein product [Arctogadus glacialis]